MSGRVAELKDAWNALESRVSLGALRVYPLEGASRAVGASLTAEGMRGLLVAVPDGERLTVPKDLNPTVGGALVAEVAHYSPPGALPARHLHIWCRDPSAYQAFDAFCGLFLDEIGDGEAGTTLRNCSDEFRRLLAPNAGKFDKAAVGLLGELLFLQRLVAMDSGLVAAWMGPTQSRHDFRAGNSAVEVKTTLRSDARNRRVRISDIDQLEPPEGGALYLHLIRIERAMKGSLTVRGLVSEISAVLPDREREHFASLIAEFKMDSEWDTGFELREQITYAVSAGFPSLTTAKLANAALDPGVSRVCYDLSLDGAAAFETRVDVAVQSLMES